MESQVRSQNSKAVNYAAIYNHEYKSNKAYGHEAYSPGYKIVNSQSHIYMKFPESERKMALDVGCGVGHAARFLDDYYESVYGIDISYEAIRTAIKNNSGRGMGFITSDVTKIPLQKHQFDLVTCFDMLEHLTETDIALARAELFRVKKKKGALLLSVSTRSADGKDYMGQNLHRTVRPVAWWKELFKPTYWEFDNINQNLVMWVK